MELRVQRDVSPRLLVVEDQPTLRLIFRRLFEARGFEVTLAEEPQMAKTLLEHQDFDYLITDLRLSELDRWEGLDVIVHARRLSPEMRIVALTGQPTPELEDACLAQGANAFLPKPQSLDSLTRAVIGIPEIRRPRTSNRTGVGHGQEAR